MDVFTPPKRSDIMRRVASKDTSLEKSIRSTIHRLGFRYRLHGKDLPGNPDLVFPKYRKVIFIHGCFWHGHDCKRGGRVPKSNTAYWLSKVEKNRKRDQKTIQELGSLGWGHLVIWECEARDTLELQAGVKRFLLGD